MSTRKSSRSRTLTSKAMEAEVPKHPTSSPQTHQTSITSKNKRKRDDSESDSMMDKGERNVKTENSKVKKEGVKVETEGVKVKVKMEDVKVKMEDVKVKTEDRKVKMEVTISKKEDRRVTIKDVKVKEDKKVKVENRKMKMEVTILKEDGKVKTEDRKVKTEDRKMKMEVTIVKKEDAKLKTENVKLKMEDSKVKPEDGKTKARKVENSMNEVTQEDDDQAFTVPLSEDLNEVHDFGDERNELSNEMDETILVPVTSSPTARQTQDTGRNDRDGIESDMESDHDEQQYDSDQRGENDGEVNCRKAISKNVINSNDDSLPAASSRTTRQTRNAGQNKRKRVESDMESDADDGDIAPEIEEEDEMYDPDCPDESNSEVKRKKAKAKSKKAKKSPKKRKHDDDDDENVKNRQEVVGELVQAPKTGRVPPGQISKNTIDFLTCLKDPKCNDRVWFKLHEPVFRQAEQEFKDFIEVFTDLLVEVDSEIPHLPPKDVIHRIYRDMRFSNDKTPYKHRFCASFSRSGRSFKKGFYAGYHVAVMPDNESLIAGGLWFPKKAELDILRTNLQRPNGARHLRQLISSPEFVKLFGLAKPHRKGKRQNVFGMEDELKSAPRGVSQGHKEINLLKLRSFVVIHTLTDTEVLSPNFKIRLMDITRVLQPFVHCLNELTTVGYVPLSSGADSEDEIEEDCGSEDEEDED